MKLNLAERLLVNNPLRALSQRRYEGPLLRRVGGRLDGARVLDVGCGSGVGIEVILKEFGAAEVQGVDLDPRQIQRAEKRFAVSRDPRVFLSLAGVNSLPFRNESFDAVFDFGMLHHVVDWQAGLAEIRRVLKPSGLFFFEEVTSDALNRWVYRAFLDHPEQNRFSEGQFLEVVSDLGLELLSQPRRVLFNDIFIGVARVPPPCSSHVTE